MKIDEAVKNTIDDFRLSRNERKSLTKLISDQPFSGKEITVLRSKVFKYAKENLNSTNAFDLIEWLEDVIKVIDKTKKSKTEIKTYFSPGEECRIAILNEIKQAKKSLNICVFTITDNQISREIINTFGRGVNVRIISDLEKADDLGSDIYRFRESGIQVKLDESEKHMHHKFLVSDKNTVLTGSYNWTVSAAEKNEENIIVLNDQSTVSRFLNEFNSLWKKF